MRSINPATEEVIAEYEAFDEARIDRALELSIERYSEWRGTSFEDRSELMRRAGEILRERSTGGNAS